MKRGQSLGKNGFTMVELLIVTVIIAILAAITIVAYNGIQNRANDSAVLSNANTIKKAINMYYTENGSYPICAGGSGVGCMFDTVSSALVPKYIGSIPDDTTYPYRYVATSNSPAMWSVRIYKKSIGDYCKVGSPNMLASWFDNAPEC